METTGYVPRGSNDSSKRKTYMCKIDAFWHSTAYLVLNFLISIGKAKVSLTHLGNHSNKNLKICIVRMCVFHLNYK